MEIYADVHTQGSHKLVACMSYYSTCFPLCQSLLHTCCQQKCYYFSRLTICWYHSFKHKSSSLLSTKALTDWILKVTLKCGNPSTSFIVQYLVIINVNFQVVREGTPSPPPKNCELVKMSLKISCTLHEKKTVHFGRRVKEKPILKQGKRFLLCNETDTNNGQRKHNKVTHLSSCSHRADTTETYLKTPNIKLPKACYSLVSQHPSTTKF